MRLDEELDPRQTASNLLLLFGVLLLIAGGWVLFHPTASDSLSDTLNLQKLYLGQTAALVGAALFGTGMVLKFLR